MARFDTAALYAFDAAYEKECGGKIAGVDEAGRGPLAGPVVAAAVILDLTSPIEGIFDSKKVPPEKRELLYDAIVARACAWGAGEASHEEIERYNILRATFMAMQRALDALAGRWSLVLVDGNLAIPSVPGALQKPVVKGDAQSASIAAASIIAKVTRDRIMRQYHQRYPAWGFDVHKGYGTALHRDRIQKNGLCDIHRRGFCRNFLPQGGPDTGRCENTQLNLSIE